MRTWIADEVGKIADPQEFMDTLGRARGGDSGGRTDRYLRESHVRSGSQLAKDYDSLWTEARYAAGGGRGSEKSRRDRMNDRYKLPARRS